MAHRKTFLALAGLLFLAVAPAFAEPPARRALVVGINHYAPASPSPGTPGEVSPPVAAVSKPGRPKGRGSWGNLDGAAEDAQSMRDVLVTAYGFRPEDVTLLIDGEATRSRILAEFRARLVDPAKPGDVSLFFYAGHGSQIRNSKSTEADGLDETIVPADAPRGALDIRDKELARLYNDALDRGALLTVVLDSCHSGSSARGGEGKARELPPDPRDAALLYPEEPVDPRPAPETRPGGALVLAAAQDHQLAYEARDEKNQAHGAFSLALLRALAEGVGQPAGAVFKRVKALMAADGRSQEPVLAGPRERRELPLVGSSPSGLSGLTVAAVRVETDGTVEVQGGSAVGLRPGAELVRLASPRSAAEVRLRISEVKGPTRSVARVARGKAADVASGDLFAVDRWVARREPGLTVWVAPSPPSAEGLRKVYRELKDLEAAGRLALVADPIAEPPTVELRWAAAGWELLAQGRRKLALGRSPRWRALPAKIPSEGRRLWANLPPPAELVRSLGASPGAAAPARRPEEAQYELASDLGSGRVRCAWLARAATQPGHRAPVDPGAGLPDRTEWVEAEGRYAAAAGELKGYAGTLARVRGWVTLDSPPDQSRFPYELVLRSLETGEARAEGTLRFGEGYQPVLRLLPGDARRVEQRYVYLFTLDGAGRATLLFPAEDSGNVENRFPGPDALRKPPAEIPLGDGFKVGPPAGVDTFLALTTAEALPDLSVLTFEGVRATRGGADSPLAGLLGGVGAPTRGEVRPVPAEWSIQRAVFRTSPAP